MEPNTERAAESHAAAALVHGAKVQRVNHQSEFGFRTLPSRSAYGVGSGRRSNAGCITWSTRTCTKLVLHSISGCHAKVSRRNIKAMPTSDLRIHRVSMVRHAKNSHSILRSLISPSPYLHEAAGPTWVPQ